MKVRTHCARCGRLSDSLSTRSVLASLVVALGMVAAPIGATPCLPRAQVVSASSLAAAAAIGGWYLAAQDCSYADDGTTRFSGHVARVAVPPEQNNASTLWAVVTDEAGASVTAVHTQSFSPASLPLGGPGVEVTCEYDLPDGHTLCLRVFDHAPSSGELGSGVLLWQQ